MDWIKKVESILQYDFTNNDLLKTAMTHKSFSYENGGGNYEYLEFVGDSVIGMIVAEYLYKNVPVEVGMMSKLRASLVSTENLGQIVDKLGLGQYIQVGNSLDKHSAKKMYADVFEAIVGAMYFDGGFALSRAVVLDMVIVNQDNVYQHLNHCTDYKTELQEYVQDKIKLPIEYITKKETGLDHEKIFEMCVRIGDITYATCSGQSKKQAEQLCAKEALKELKNK